MNGFHDIVTRVIRVFVCVFLILRFEGDVEVGLCILQSRYGCHE